MFILKEREKGRYAVIEYDQFKEGSTFEQTAAIWRGSIHCAPFSLKKGKYNLVISARGDPAQGQFPHLNIYINNKKIGDYYLTGAIEGKCFVFENSEPGQLTLTVEMDNDFYKPGLADRNAFVQKIIIVPLKLLNISK